MISKLAQFFVFCFIFFPGVILAATTTDFTISTLVGDDIVPPTTPTLLSVTPTAPTQIDVSWTAATDNYLLSGYVLLRDGVAIATTTLTSYIDTGLTPETLYTYEVYAFDSFFNLSTTSNALATTTPAVPVTPPVATTTQESGSTATLVFRLLSFTITPSTNSALFAWETSMPARYALRWGRSDAYNDGYILNDTYRQEQVTQITELTPGTTYFYELIGYAASGRVLELRSGQFTTVARENLAPQNVQNFTARTQGEDVQLTYVLPQSTPGVRVRIVRNHLGYPLDPYDGEVIYEGTDTSFLDTGAFTTYGTQYYTAFVVSGDGAVSSGALAMARAEIVPVKPGEEPGTPPEPEPEIPLPEQPGIEIPDFDFTIESITLSQGADTFSFESESVTLFAQEAFLISIKKDALPDNLKSIIITLVDPTNPKQQYSFLLRINAEGTAYEAVIAPLRAAGASYVQVEIFDFERSVVGRYLQPVTFVEQRVEAAEVVFPDTIVKALSPFFGTVSLLFLVLLLLFFFLYRRERAVADKV